MTGGRSYAIFASNPAPTRVNHRARLLGEGEAWDLEGGDEQSEGVCGDLGVLTYQHAGVNTDQASTGLKGLLHWVVQMHSLRQDVGGVRLPIGYYANVIDIGHGLGLAISTDGVGSKLLVAQLMDQYDTVGIDCVAMNANDILCVGARPLSLPNLRRIQASLGFVIEQVPEPQPIFRLIQARGRVSEAEMYQVFTMGLGFCVVAAPMAVAQVHAIARQHGVATYDLGHAVTDPEWRVWLRPKHLVSAGNTFVSGASDL